VVLALRDKLPRSVNTTIPLRSKTALGMTSLFSISCFHDRRLGTESFGQGR